MGFLWDIVFNYFIPTRNIYIMKRAFLFLTLLFASNSCLELGLCDLGDVHIYLNNLTEKDVACYVADGLNSGFSYPDTDLPNDVNFFCLKERINKRSAVWSGRAGNFENLLKTTQQGILSIYIFDQETIDIEGIRAVFLNNNYIARYDLTAENLESLNGDIYYPPTPSMRNVQMFPLFDSCYPE